MSPVLSMLTDNERWRPSLFGVVRSLPPRLRRRVLASAFSRLGALATASASPPNKCVHGLTYLGHSGSGGVLNKCESIGSGGATRKVSATIGRVTLCANPRSKVEPPRL